MTQRDDLAANYLSYMLRLWRTRNQEGKAVWHASTQASGTHLTRNFTDLDDLVDFLSAQMAGTQDDDGNMQKDKDRK